MSRVRRADLVLPPLPPALSRELGQRLVARSFVWKDHPYHLGRNHGPRGGQEKARECRGGDVFFARWHALLLIEVWLVVRAC
jgi:hypothetical protein